MENIKDTNWFSISNSGWRRLNAGRKMGHLVREAIANVFDAPNVTNCSVAISPGHVIIEDDNPAGITDPSLIYTVFMTDKEDSATKRGRKGRGLKELISAADKAVVESVGITVTFDENGRTETKNDRRKGTKVEIWSKLWNTEDVAECKSYLCRIITPTDIKFTINDRIVVRPDIELVTWKVYLPTVVIKDGIQSEIAQITEVRTYKLRNGEKKGWLYEMGIPIQELNTKFHVDVAQRIPMNDNRDMVEQYYVNRVLGHVLTIRIERMDKQELSQDWVAGAINNCTSDVCAEFTKKFIGSSKVVIKSDKRSNDTVRTRGYELLDLSAVPDNLRFVFEDTVMSAKTLAVRLDKERTPVDVATSGEEMERFVAVMSFLGEKVLGKKVNVGFYTLPTDSSGFTQVACYDKVNSIVKFNTYPNRSFDKPLSEGNLTTLIHELTHEFVEDHEEEFRKKLEVIAGKVAWVILTHRDEIPFINEVKMKQGKTEFITCCDCGTKREVKVQDVFHTKRCVDCQKKHQKLKRKENRALIRSAMTNLQEV